VAVLAGSVPASAVRSLSHINVSTTLPISPLEVEDWVDSPVSSTVPVPVRKTKNRRHRPAPVPFVNIEEVRFLCC